MECRAVFGPRFAPVVETGCGDVMRDHIEETDNKKAALQILAIEEDKL